MPPSSGTPAPGTGGTPAPGTGGTPAPGVVGSPVSPASDAGTGGPAETPTRPARLPWFRTLGDYAWRLVAVGVVVYFGIHLLSHLSLVVVPFVGSLLVTALLHPVLNRFRRFGLHRGLATLATMVVTVVLVGGILTIVVIRAADEAPQLGDEINRLIPQVEHWLVRGPLRLNQSTVNNLTKTLSNEVTKNSSKIAATALSTGKTALDVLGELLLGIFSTIFLLYDGKRIWTYLVQVFPPPGRSRADAAGHAAWRTLSLYVRGTLIVAAFHGVVMAITLTILGVPLAFPLAVLIGLGSFVPLVGAVITGALAVAVAGLSKGLVAAIVVLAVLLADNQVEAHALQPFVVGRYVRIHPLAVVLGLATGGLLFGIFGAIIAVPVIACANSAVRAGRDPPTEGGGIPPPG